MLNAEFIRSKISDEVIKSLLQTKELVDFSGDVEITAIDIGYGYTKYIKGIENGELACDLFPSQAALSPTQEVSGGFFVSRNTKKIPFGGNDWEVGPDVYDIASKSEVRALHEDFISTEQWMILFLGALEYIGKENIDMLILGLPVSNMSKEDEMRKIAIGTHKVGEKEYHIKDVMVVPQPLGALYNHAVSSKENFDRFSKTNTLIVDPGYLTFDFLVTRGFKVSSHRSGARPGGMSAVLNAIAQSISQEIGEKYDDNNEIDVTLDLKNYGGVKDTRPIYIYGEEIDLNKHIMNTRPVIDASLNFMLNVIGDPKDIAQVVMGGGPAKIFDRSIKGQFPKHKMETMDAGIFANVLGFMYWGMMVYYGMRMNQKEEVVA